MAIILPMYAVVISRLDLRVLSRSASALDAVADVLHRIPSLTTSDIISVSIA